jgi:hypothetical protein
MIRITLRVDHFSFGIGVDNDPTADRTVTADRGGFLCPFNPEFLGIRFYRRKIESQATHHSPCGCGARNL